MQTIRDLLSISFRDLEQMLFQELSEAYCEMLSGIMEQLDALLYADRDSKRFMVQERRERSIESLFGTVRFKRRTYRDRAVGGYVALLDEALHLEKGKKLSDGLLEKAIWQGVHGPSYRGAESSLENFYGRPVLSHEAIRQGVLQIGDLIAKVSAQEREKSIGQRHLPCLFLEVDGLHAHIQREPRRRSIESRIGVVHEGWRPRYNSGEKDYELINPSYCVVEPGADFWEAMSRHVYSRYDVSGSVVLINGDRAPWIGQGVDYFSDAACVLYQWDRYHIARDLRSVLRNQPKRLKQALEAFDKNDVIRLLIALAEAEGAENETELKEAIQALKEAVLGNQELVQDYRFRLAQKGFDTTGLRGMGAAESTMDRFANRVKKRGQSWGRRGLQAMMLALGKYFEDDLGRYTEHVAKLQQLVQQIQFQKNHAGRITKRMVKQVYQPRQGGLPIKGAGRGASYSRNNLMRNISQPAFNL